MRHQPVQIVFTVAVSGGILLVFVAGAWLFQRPTDRDPPEEEAQVQVALETTFDERNTP